MLSESLEPGVTSIDGSPARRRLATSLGARMTEEFGPENAWETTRAANPDGHASSAKRLKAWYRRVIPKAVL